MFIKGIFAGTLSGSLNALIAEASGYTTRTTGVHMDGMMYSCSSLGVKVGGGIGTAAVGWLLKLGGFVGTATVQSESAIRMIFNLYITFPFMIWASSSPCCWPSWMWKRPIRSGMLTMHRKRHRHDPAELSTQTGP